MSSRSYHYRTRYGYPFGIAGVAEFWWRVEHVGYYRGGDGGLFGVVRRLGYRQRKAWERRGYFLASTPAPSADVAHQNEPVGFR